VLHTLGWPLLTHDAASLLGLSHLLLKLLRLHVLLLRLHGLLLLLLLLLRQLSPLLPSYCPLCQLYGLPSLLHCAQSSCQPTPEAVTLS
jgi:hypothetical protein